MQLKTLLYSASIFACISSANAADVIKHHKHHVKKPAHITQIIVAPVMPIAPSRQWAGPYLGFETGTVMAKFHPTNGDTGIVDGISKPKEQPLAGLFAGYNFAIGRHAILGLDGNIDYHAVESFSTAGSYGHYKENALAAARVKLGFAQARFMPYIAGGLSAARAGLSLHNTAATPNDVKRQKTYLGWNVGGGIDFAVAHNMFLRADYRFSRIKIKDMYFIDATGNVQRIDANIATKSHEIRIGAAYKF